MIGIIKIYLGKNFILTSHTGLLETLLKLLSFSLKIFPFKKNIINYFDYFSRYGFYYQFITFTEYLKNKRENKKPIKYSSFKLDE